MSITSALVAAAPSLKRSRAEVIKPKIVLGSAPRRYNCSKRRESRNGRIVSVIPRSANGPTNCSKRYRVAAASLGYDAKAKTFMGIAKDGESKELKSQAPHNKSSDKNLFEERQKP